MEIATLAPYFEILDISTPTAPSSVGKVAIPEQMYGYYAGELQIIGIFAFLPTGVQGGGGANGGLLVFDISDESVPVVDAFVPIADASDKLALPGGGLGPGLEVKDGKVYLASKTGLYIFNVSDPADPQILVNPNEVDALKLPDEFLPSEGGWVDIEGGYAYVTSAKSVSADAGGLAVFKLPAFEYECDLFLFKELEGDAGNVHIERSGDGVSVNVSGENGWTLKSSKIHLGDIDTSTGDLTGFPVNKPGNPTPGQFEFKEQAAAGEVLFTLTAEELYAADDDGDGIIAIALQAELYNQSGTRGINKDAWAACDGFEFLFPGSSGATVMQIDLEELGFFA